ncbi:TolC family protein [Algibacter mikhailovii]|uniref:TolC family protein n=1 Tax=Algibacter mikhailovii TaxID=425498 RepID=UPI0024944834|nr:TolC family protein [Algibacter mikhailovii]
MQTLKKISLLIVLFTLLLGVNKLAGQDKPMMPHKEESFALLIPKLGILIDSALVHNGLVNYRKLEIDAKESNLKSKRKYWTRNFGVQADSRYGTFDNYSSISGDNATINLASNTQQLNYNVGLYLKIPVFDVINRKSQIKQAEAELAQAKSLVKSQEDELREMVIRYYEDLLLQQNLLEIRATNLGNAKVNMEMVEKEFKNGLVEITEYVRISDMTSRISADFQKVKSDFIISKKLLENLVGFEIQ